MRFRLHYLQGFVDSRTGAVYTYFRRRGYPRVRLPGLPGSPEFMAAYQAALTQQQQPIGVTRSKPGSVNAALAGYFTSLEFRSLAFTTQRDRRAILQRFRHEYGHQPIALLPSKFITAMLSKMKPFAARNWLKAIRHLMQFCVAQEFCSTDPTRDIKLPRMKSDGYHTWSEDEIAAFESKHPIGSKPRLALALLLYTGQRRGDVLRMGRQHIRDGVLQVKQEKTRVTLAIPVHGDLQIIIDATPGQHLTFLTNTRNRPYTGVDFARNFRKWCEEAKLPTACVVHGLRKAACRRLAEAGCSANEIAAISGHATLREVERYTKAVNQLHMARSAMRRTANTTATTSVKNSKV
jgi:integrase